MSKFIFLFFFFFSITHAQYTDTLKYYNPYATNTLAFIDDCGAPGYCEPIAVWFTPDSSCADSTMKYYSIKKIRFCFAGLVDDDTTFTIHLGDGLPDFTNQVYKRYISVDTSDINPEFGTYKFKEFDVSGVSELKNILINTSFWVELQNKVWALWNTTYNEPIFSPSFHSYYNGLPNLAWTRLDGDWVVEAVIEYHKILSLEYFSSEGVMPRKAHLFQNYPNPFNASESSIKYSLYKSGFIQLDVYSNLGEKVRTLVNKNQRGGVYDVKFNIQDLSSGVYFYVLKMDGEQVDSKKMTFIK